MGRKFSKEEITARNALKRLETGERKSLREEYRRAKARLRKEISDEILRTATFHAESTFPLTSRNTLLEQNKDKTLGHHWQFDICQGKGKRFEDVGRWYHRVCNPIPV